MLVFVLSVLLPILTARGEDPDMLWQYAVDLASRNADLYPGTISQHEKLQLNDGIVMQDSETVLRLYDEGGEVGVEVIRVVVNQKDVTKKARRNLARSESEIDHTIEHPFMAEAQDNMRYATSGMNETIRGRSCVKYSFSFSDEESGWEGETWIEKKTGIPIQTEASLTTVPFVEDGVTIQSLQTVTEYGSGPGGMWFPDRLEVRVDIVFEKGMPGGKRSASSGPQYATVLQELLFEDFWRLK
jgi:hypothetical protein